MSEPPRLADAPRTEPPPARPTSLFFLILPSTIWATFLLGLFIQEAIWRSDVRHFNIFILGLKGWPLLFLPMALTCLVIAAVHTFRKRKFILALLIGLGWNLLLLAVFWALIYLIPK